MVQPHSPKRLIGTARNPAGDPRSRRNQTALSIHPSIVGVGLIVLNDGTIVVDDSVFIPYAKATGNADITTGGTHPFTMTAYQFIASAAIGTAPLVITSTDLVTNLNADLLDGQHGSYYAGAAVAIPYSGATGDADLGVHNLTTTGVITAANFQISTAPTANVAGGTVAIVAKDANLLTANAGWLQFKRSDGTIVYMPYWL
jgi:hypothetical protein